MEKPFFIGEPPHEREDASKIAEDSMSHSFPNEDVQNVQKDGIVKPFVFDLSYAEKQEERRREQQMAKRSEEQKESLREQENPCIDKMGGVMEQRKLPMIRPFQIISDEADRLASEYVRVLGRNYDFLIPTIARTVDFQLSQGCEVPLPENYYRVHGNFNFSLCLKRLQKFISDTSKGERFDVFYLMEVQVYFRNGRIESFEATVPADKIKSADWMKKATASKAIQPKEKAEKKEFENMIQNCIEMPNVPVEIIYPAPGWRNVPDFGWRYVYHDGIIGEQNALIHTGGDKNTLDLHFERVGLADTFQKAVQMMEICSDRRTSTSLFVITHAAMLTRLFKLAKHPISFIFVMEAPTNSRKTSLALAVSQVFDRGELKAAAEFANMTEGGAEKTLSLFPDAPVHVDDFKPGVDKTDQKQMEKRLDKVARFGGNGVAKVRMTDFMPNSESKYFPPGGVTIVTAELINAVPSSESRMFISEFGKDTVVNERLEFFQENTWLLPTHLYDFISWVTGNFDRTVNHIRESFPLLRKEFRFEFGRYAEMFATFVVTAEIIAEYACARGFWDQQAGERFIRHIRQMVMVDLRAMEEKIGLRDKGMLILDALAYALSHKKLQPVKLTGETSGKRYEVYEDDVHLFVQTKELRRVVSEYGAVYNDQRMIVNDDELCMELERKSVLDIHVKSDGTRERSRKLPIQRGNTLRYLWLTKAKIDQTGV